MYGYYWEKFHFHHLWELRVKTIGFPPSCDEYLKRSESLVIMNRSSRMTIVCVYPLFFLLLSFLIKIIDARAIIVEKANKSLAPLPTVYHLSRRSGIPCTLFPAKTETCPGAKQILLQIQTELR